MIWTQVLKRALLSGAALGVIGVASGAHAQTATPRQTEPQTATQVDEIIVTAQRRAERVEDIPMVVASVSAEDVESRGLTNLHDLGQAVPGVQINMGGGFTQTAVRGVGTLTTGVGTENNVSLYIDGFYQPDTATLGADFANIAGVEVLKGPQGTLWGRNATGGAILLTTLKPSDVLTGKLEGKIGNFNERAYSGYISGPVTDRIRYSVAGYARNTDGYYDSLDNQGNVIGHAAPIRSISVRTKLDIDLTSDLNVVLAANYTDYSDPRGLLFVVERYPLSLLPAPPARATRPRTWTGNRVTEQDSTIKEVTATATWKTAIGDLTSYTGYARRDIDSQFDFDASFADISFSDTIYYEDSYQQAVDFTFKPWGNLDLTVGGTYWNDEVNSDPSYNSANYVRLQESHSKVSTEAWAAFFDANYHFTDKLTLNFGGRYTNEDREYSSRQLNSVTGMLAGPEVVAAPVSFSNFSPRVSLRYEIAARSNVYASYSKGFRSGGSQVLYVGGNSIIVPIEPEEIAAYEVGFKTAQPFGQFEVAAFHYDYTNIQVATTITNPLCGLSCAPINATSNAPEATVDGVEASVTFSPIENLDISLGGAYLKAEYTDFPAAVGNGFNATTGLNAASQVQNWNGQQMARAPEFSGNVSISYVFPDVAGGTLTPSANFKYTDSYVLNNASLYGPLAGPDLANKQRYREGAYGLLNLSLTYESANGYTLAGYVNNATGVDYHLNMSGSAFGDYGTWASPTTYGMRLGYKF